MSTNYIALAIPFFFVLIAAEALVARRARRRVYRLSAATSDLGCGVTQQVTVRFFEASLLLGYGYVHARFGLLPLSAGAIGTWALAFVGVDLLYYWWHRLSHEVNVLWAVHVVHHHSEDYNLAVALRQAVLSPLSVFPFYLPLAVVGVPPLVFATASAVNTLYQFWIHTELVGTIGPAEAVLNTPSHHRVHHAVNPRYLDRNYGGILIVWDRLFGSFEPEGERAVYGVSTPLRSFNPLYAQVEHWLTLLGRTRRAPGWADGARVWVKSPAWHPVWFGPPSPPRRGGDMPKYEARAGRALGRYIGANFALVVALTFSLLMWGAGFSLPVQAAIAGLVLLSLLTASGLVERKAWAVPLELARLALLVVGACAVFRGGPGLPCALGGAALVALAAARFVTRESAERPGEQPAPLAR